MNASPAPTEFYWHPAGPLSSDSDTDQPGRDTGVVVRIRRWFFTYNTPKDGERELLHDYFTLHCTKACTALEHAPSTGREHIQGAVTFNGPRTFSSLKEAWPMIHWEPSKGTDAEIYDYLCKEDTDVWTVGSWALPARRRHGPGQGHRSDLEALWHACQVPGATWQSVSRDHPAQAIRYPSGIARALNTAASSGASDIRDINVDVYWGPTGSGKTHLALERVRASQPPGMEPYIITLDRADWWDCYAGQPAILIDDFASAEYPITKLKRLLDKYPLRLPVKGGFTWAKWNHVFITSNEAPEAWYLNELPEHRAAIARRLTRVVKMEARA